MAQPLSHVVTWFVALTLAVSAAPQAAGSLTSATEAVRAAIAERLGLDAEISVAIRDLEDGPARFREARPDPNAKLGDRPIRFALITSEGAAMSVSADVTVVAAQVVVRRPVLRGHAVTAADVETVKDRLNGVPITRLPAAGEVIGARALRPLDPGTVVLPSFVAIRRAVEPGDTVTVIALAGPVEVSAMFVAADGGQVGDVIRVRNSETRKYVRGRIVKAGQVEVFYER